MPLFPSPCSMLARQFLPTAAKFAASVHARTVLDFGPAFLPKGNGLQRAIPNEQKKRENADLSVSCFSLSLLTREELVPLLDAMHCASPYVLLADFKVAERNLEVPACLLMGGIRKLSPSEAGCFKSYGGLEGLLYAERARFQPLERLSLLGGSLSCVLARNL